MFEVLSAVLFDYTVRNIALGSAILGVAGGVLGCFAVLRRQSLLGDALAHATLPGICVVFMLTQTRVSLWLLLGAGLSAWLGALAILAVVRGTRIKQDAALGIVLSVFFGAGVVLLTLIQQTGAAGQSGIDRFLFGQAASLIRSDVITMGALAGAALLVVGVFYKEFKLLTFDGPFAASLGLPVRVLDVLLTSLIVVAVIVGIQAVGVILMAAMLITPAAAARQWTDRLSAMILISALFGAGSGVAGALVSALGPNLPTGPLIVLIATGVFLFSLLFGASRGLLWSHLRERRNRAAALSGGGA
jgi:manganese/zinc/iron transport system permease protein